MKICMTAIGLSLALLASAQAGGLDQPIVDPVVIADAAATDSASSAPLVLGLTVLTLFGAAAAN